MRNSIDEIRKQEKAYHDQCYENLELFAEGSWMHKPVASVLRHFAYFDGKPEVHVLDLGSGVGRNSIPLASKLSDRAGSVVCVDLLDSAITKLTHYAAQYGVTNTIQPVKSDIGRYRIEPDSFDYIVAVSTLEHVDSEEAFDRTLARMVHGTKNEGINYILISTNIREKHMASKQSLLPMFELLFDTDSLVHKLQSHYEGWTVLEQIVKPYALEIERNGECVLLESDVLIWAVQKMN
ncbi:class I SAM-dependent methyltransferase [Paenibacillus sp. MMS18-CY102]|uniref:class I SAM-dependent methyltransferase n=1 Tax=Paenibacillus sp. MMS18-CY102 TaxID=2682849 RepID=UPI0013660921|nr:class I SAM-dependent methyltransferase [Paenibacillus sp. MMS18-CY102]MWC27028.1 methyltransferase domain-containing protein [Paenibacillus sp. MMS18-CY102]